MCTVGLDEAMIRAYVRNYLVTPLRGVTHHQALCARKDKRSSNQRTRVVLKPPNSDVGSVRKTTPDCQD